MSVRLLKARAETPMATPLLVWFGLGIVIDDITIEKYDSIENRIWMY